MKETIYNIVVRGNEHVRYEYERYVQEHLVQHYEHKLVHWKMLWKLNWHYRVKKSTEPMLYWDKKFIINQNGAKKQAVSSKIEKTSVLKECKHYPESEALYRKDWKKVLEELLPYDIVSFDIFDTVILRNVSNPKDVFHLLAIRNNISDFLQLRVAAEEEARSNSERATREVTLKDIYTILNLKCGIDIEKGIKNELDMEYAICEGNPYICKIVNELHEYNKKIIFVSDTYFSADYINLLLKKCGINFDTEIYVSCEYGRGKYDDGALFSIVSSKYLPMTRFVHVGDNKINDYLMPQKHGWDSVYYANVNEIGMAYRNKKVVGVNSAIYRGIVNNHLHNGTVITNAHYEYGFTYGGWIACGFCRWLNRLAKTEKIDKFLFMSRDCFYIHKIYNNYYQEVDNEYITISRYAAMQLSFKKYTENFINFNILRRAEESNETIGKVLEELEISVIKQYLGTIGLHETDMLTCETFPFIKALILAYKNVIWEEFAEARKAAKKYFEPYIKNSKKICLVDIGWNGTSIVFMKHFFEEECNFEVECIGALVAGAFSKFTTAYWESKIINSYLFSSSHNRELFDKHDFSVYNLFMEILFTEPCPSFINFTINKQTNDVEKRFALESEENNNIVKNIGRGILDFVQKYNQVINQLDLDLEIEARNTYEPLLEAMQNKAYMYLLFENYKNQILPGITDTSVKAGEYLKSKNYIE